MMAPEYKGEGATNEAIWYVNLIRTRARWYDIKRWGTLEEAFTSADSYEPHAVVKSRDYLFPIPQAEISITGFTQNPGY